MNLASIATDRHPLDDNYKFEILKTNLKFDKPIESYIQPTDVPTKPPLNYEELEAKFKERYDFTRSDDKILSDIFAL